MRVALVTSTGAKIEVSHDAMLTGGGYGYSQDLRSNDASRLR